MSKKLSIFAGLVAFFEIDTSSAWISGIGALKTSKNAVQQLSKSRKTTQFAKARTGSGFGSSSKLSGKPSRKKKQDSSRKIYSMPALYDLAFGYRDFEGEVSFLLQTHEEYSQVVDNEPFRILELAAGPARHAISALALQDSNRIDDNTLTIATRVDSVTCIDSSTDMEKYAQQTAAEELSPDQLAKFRYKVDDMRTFELDDGEKESFDTAWMLLGSLQHLTSNAEIIECFESIRTALKPGGTIIIELPHPRETFSMGECTRNGWEVPLDDDEGNAAGSLKIVWGDEDDKFDPVTQVRLFTVSMVLEGAEKTDEMQSVREVVPLRLFTTQEIDALSLCSRLNMVGKYGALEEGVSVDDEELAFRLVCVLRKPLEESQQ